MGVEKKVSSPPSRMSADFRSQIEGQRAYLLRYASLQLRNPEAAEDAVQETRWRRSPAKPVFAGSRTCAPG